MSTIIITWPPKCLVHQCTYLYSRVRYARAPLQKIVLCVRGICGVQYYNYVVYVAAKSSAVRPITSKSTTPPTPSYAPSSPRSLHINRWISNCTGEQFITTAVRNPSRSQYCPSLSTAHGSRLTAPCTPARSPPTQRRAQVPVHRDSCSCPRNARSRCRYSSRRCGLR